MVDSSLTRICRT